VTEPRIVIYTTPFCGYCAAAKRLLRKKATEFKEIDVMMDADRRQEMLAKRNGRRTVPQIFIDGRHIGGYDDVYALDQAGKLDELLAPLAASS